MILYVNMNILPNINQDDLHLPDMHFMLMDEIIAFDHMRQKIVIIVNIHAEGDIENQYKKATGRLLDIQQEMTEPFGTYEKKKSANIVLLQRWFQI